MASIKEVAEKAGVSTTTVSFVLNNKGQISEQTRQHVLGVVEEMGYTRSVHARNLRNQQSRVIGYTWDQYGSEFNLLMDKFLYELTRLAELNERHLLLFAAHSQGEIETYRNLYNSQLVDGFILSHTNQNDARFQYLYATNVPFVAFGRSASALDAKTCWVDIDGRAGIYAATEHLIQQGHTRIAMIAWPAGSVSGDLRFAGFADALKEYEIPYIPELVVRAHNKVENGYIAAQDLMRQDIAPTAIIAISDTLAIGAMRYLAEANLKIAVTGFDDTPIAQFMYPPLTSIRQPILRVAEILIDMLLAQLNGETISTTQYMLKPELIIRSSSMLDY